MLPTKMHMTAPRAVALKMAPYLQSWQRASICGKLLRLELTTEDWAKVSCKMCLKVKRAMK